MLIATTLLQRAEYHVTQNVAEEKIDKFGNSPSICRI